MASVDTDTSLRPARWGLAAKLFAIITLLGAIAVLVTGVLGSAYQLGIEKIQTVGVAYMAVCANGIPDGIQVTRPVYEKLKDEFVFEPRGLIEGKGKGSVEAWLFSV